MAVRAEGLGPGFDPRRPSRPLQFVETVAMGPAVAAAVVLLLVTRPWPCLAVGRPLDDPKDVKLPPRPTEFLSPDALQAAASKVEPKQTLPDGGALLACPCRRPPAVTRDGVGLADKILGTPYRRPPSKRVA